MSTLDEKLEQPRASVGDRARATAKQLWQRWSAETIIDGDTISIRPMGGEREVWRRVTGELFEREEP